jgi:ferrous iron transport protein A
MTLADQRNGAVLRIVQVHCPGVTGVRLLEMGLVPGTTVEVIDRGRLGLPMQLLVRNYRLSVRRAEARRIEVQG